MRIAREKIRSRNALIFYINFKEERVMESGISTLGITFGYGMETTAGVKPTVFTQLHRINSIGGITIESEQIDASALEDLVSRYIQGRGDTGGTFPVGVNYTSETLDEWEGVISAYNAAKGTGKRMWFETIIPGFSKSEFVVAQPPAKIPSPEKNQNELLIVEMNLTIEEFVGMETTVPFTTGDAQQ